MPCAGLACGPPICAVSADCYSAPRRGRRKKRPVILYVSRLLGILGGEDLERQLAGISQSEERHSDDINERIGLRFSCAKAVTVSNQYQVKFSANWDVYRTITLLRCLTSGQEEFEVVTALLLRPPSQIPKTVNILLYPSTISIYAVILGLGTLRYRDHAGPAGAVTVALLTRA